MQTCKHDTATKPATTQSLDKRGFCTAEHNGRKGVEHKPRQGW